MAEMLLSVGVHSNSKDVIRVDDELAQELFVHVPVGADGVHRVLKYKKQTVEAVLKFQPLASSDDEDAERHKVDWAKQHGHCLFELICLCRTLRYPPLREFLRQWVNSLTLKIQTGPASTAETSDAASSDADSDAASSDADSLGQILVVGCVDCLSVHAKDWSIKMGKALVPKGTDKRVMQYSGIRWINSAEGEEEQKRFSDIIDFQRQGLLAGQAVAEWKSVINDMRNSRRAIMIIACVGQGMQFGKNTPADFWTTIGSMSPEPGQAPKPPFVMVVTHEVAKQEAKACLVADPIAKLPLQLNLDNLEVVSFRLGDDSDDEEDDDDQDSE